MKMLRLWIIPLALFVFAGSTGPLLAGEAEDALTFSSVPVEHYNFSSVDKDAQMWSAMYIASNNKIYIGLCTHGDAATVYEFDIATRGMRQLANLTVLLDERGRGTWTNGKIHARMQELDGYIYFGSFCEDNGPPAIDANSYGGPFWFRIEMASGKVEKLNQINSFWGLLGQAMDKQRRIVYGLAENGNLYRYFIDRKYTEDLGRVDSWDICRTIFTDDQGNVYGSYPPGRIWKYDPEQDRVFDLQHTRLPVINVSRTMANPMLDRKSQWRYIEWDQETGAAFGMVGGSNLLFRFDVHQGPEGKVTPLKAMCAPQYLDGDPFKIPHATLAMTISQRERKIYYIPVMSGDFDYGAVVLDVAGGDKYSSRLAKGRKLPPLSFMVSYDIASGEREYIGLLRAADGRYTYGLGAAETDSEGRVWFVGAFEEPDSAFVAGRMAGMPYSMGLGCYDPFANGGAGK